VRHERHPDSNPSGNAFTESETDLLSVKAAIRPPRAEAARAWRVKNPAKRHAHSGRPVAYHLHPAPVRRFVCLFVGGGVVVLFGEHSDACRHTPTSAILLPLLNVHLPC
jgi:hypothetical protein